MRSLYQALTVSLLLAATPACKRTGAQGRSSTEQRANAASRPRPKPGMPRPLKLPANPAAAVHVQALDSVLAAALAYTTPGTDARSVLQQATRRAHLEFESQLVAHVDLSRPVDLAIVEGQTIAVIPIVRSQLGSVANLLRLKPPAGSFGAVDLQRSQGSAGPRLAWLDDKSATITLASDLQGIATGTKLGARYGKRPLYFTLGQAEAARYGIELPVARITAIGNGVHDFELTTDGMPNDPQVQQALAKISAGALTGMLQSPTIALGISTKYTDYKPTVDAIIKRGRRIVSAQNFLVQGVLQDLLGRTSSVLRSWNGRVLAGVGPARHVLVAFGSDDPTRASNATLHLVAGILDNIKLANSFGLDGGIPKIRFARNKANTAGTNVHVVALERAKRYLPVEAHGLVNDRGDLRVAVAFSNKAGGGMFVAGPDAPDVLSAWLAGIEHATTAQASAGDLVAATFAVSPEQLAPVLGASEPSAALRLRADRDPTSLVLRQQGNSMKLSVEGPRLALPPVRTSVAPARRVPKRTPVRAAQVGPKGAPTSP